MTARQRLPNRRQCESFEFSHADLGFTLCAGSYPDGRVAEIFLSANRVGSPIEAIARDAAVTVSIALRFGADLERSGKRLQKTMVAAQRRSRRGTRRARGGRAMILGIDIGIQGAVAILDQSGTLIEIHDMPVLKDGASRAPCNPCAIARPVIFKSHATQAFVESGNARQGEGPLPA